MVTITTNEDREDVAVTVDPDTTAYQALVTPYPVWAAIHERGVPRNDHKTVNINKESSEKGGTKRICQYSNQRYKNAPLMSADYLVDRRTVHTELKAVIKLKQKEADGWKLESAEIALQQR